MIEQLRIITQDGRELFNGPDYLPARMEYGDVFVCAGERLHVAHAQPFRAGNNRRVLLSRAGESPNKSIQATGNNGDDKSNSPACA